VANFASACYTNV